MEVETPHARQQVIAFAAISLSFVAAAAFSAVRAAAVDGPALAIADRVAPSIHELAAARLQLRQVENLLRQPAPDRSAMLEEWQSCRLRLDAFLAIPTDDRGSLRQELKEAATQFDAQLTAALAPEVLRASARNLSAVALAITEHEGAAAKRLATRIQWLRRTAAWTSAALTLAALCLSALCAVLLSRALRRHARLAADYARVQEQRADELDQFAARVAHDLRNPVAAAGLSLSTIERAPTLEQVRAPLERAKRALEHAHRVLDALWAFARSGARPEPEARCSVPAVIAQVVEDLKPAVERQVIELRTSSAGELEARCVQGMLACAVENLVSNAIKYMGGTRERRIDVRAARNDDRIRIEVEDTGPGIPPGTEDVIFEPYVRVSKLDRSGLGIGLATVRRVAESYGGAAGVSSRPGQGSTFWLEIPAA